MLSLYFGLGEAGSEFFFLNHFFLLKRYNIYIYICIQSGPKLSVKPRIGSRQAYDGLEPEKN